MKKLLNNWFIVTWISVIFLLIGISYTVPQASRVSYVIGNNFYLNGDVSRESLAPLVVLLQESGPSDTVVMHINSYGGDAYAGFKAIKEMRQSRAGRIVAIVQKAESMAAFLAIESNHIQMLPNSIIVVHYGSLGVVNHIFTYADISTNAWFMGSYVKNVDKYLHIQAGQFLTPEAWDTIHKGGAVGITPFVFHMNGGDVYDGRDIDNPALNNLY